MAKSEVFNMDCIEYMRSLPSKYFDLAVCDPPFGKGNDDTLDDRGAIPQGRMLRKVPQAGTDSKEDGERSITALRNRGGQNGSEKDSKDTSSRNRFQGGTWATRYRVPMGGGTELEAPTWDIAPPQEFFDELFRVSKNQIIWGGNYFSLPPTRCFLVWKKTNIAEGFSMAMCEYAWTSFKGNAKVFDYSSLRKDNSGKFHPTEKPQELYAWTYKLFVDKNQTVFDPMMGSQASRVVAYKMGIDYIGCEIDKYYFDKGCEFFNRECLGTKKTENGKSITQLNLF